VFDMLIMRACDMLMFVLWLLLLTGAKIKGFFILFNCVGLVVGSFCLVLIDGRCDGFQRRGW
jgi:hypothetical protein